jgi:YHS domain-containing protein
MKKVLILGFFTLSILAGCDKSLKDSGEITVPNGKGEGTKIKYACKNCLEYIEKTDVFNKVIDEITKNAKNSLKYPLSFVPVSIDINVEPITDKYYYSDNEPVEGAYNIFYTYKYIAKNAYNTEIEGEHEDVINIVGSGIMPDFYKLLRLDSLYVMESNDEYRTINRNLLAINNDEYIKITPMIYKDRIALVVKSSFTCLDKGTSLTFSFVDLPKGDNLKIESWNDFNCEGNAYYFLTKKQLKQFKDRKIQYISMYYKESLVVFLDRNKQDYFDQLASLIDL